MEISKCLLWGGRYIKPGFHMIVPITPVVSKKFRDDPDNWDYWWFLCDRPGDCLNDKRHGVISDVSGSDNRIFLCGFHKQAKHTGNDGF